MKSFIRIQSVLLFVAMGPKFHNFPAAATFAPAPAGVQQSVPTDEQNASVEGTVTDAATRKPIEGVVITEVGQSRATATTDASGHYLVNGLKPGTYASIAQKDDYPNTNIRRLSLMPGMKAEHINFRLQKGAILAGRVTDSERTPIPGGTVEAWSRVYRDGRPRLLFRGKAHVDEAGNYHLAGLGGGLYYLQASPPKLELQKLQPVDASQKPSQNATRIRVFYPNIRVFDQAVPFHVRAAEHREGMDFVLDRISTFCVIASVRRGSGSRDPESILIMVTEAGEDWNHQVGGGSANPGERFKVCGLIPGVSYVLTATTWLDDSKLAAFASQEFVAAPRDADLGFLDIGTLALQSGRPVPGKVIILDQKPDEPFPGRFRVAVEPSHRTSFMNETHDAIVEESGDFLLPNVLPDDHFLRVLGLPSGYYVKEVTFNQRELRQGAFTPGQGELHVALQSDGATLEGQVVTKDNQPVTDAQIILAPKSTTSASPAARVMAAQPDQNGNFRFSSGAVPGDYRVVAVVGLLDEEAENFSAVSVYLSYGTEINLVSHAHQSVVLTAINAN